jgi:hypothetical protein
MSFSRPARRDEVRAGRDLISQLAERHAPSAIHQRRMSRLGTRMLFDLRND